MTLTQSLITLTENTYNTEHRAAILTNKIKALIRDNKLAIRVNCKENHVAVRFADRLNEKINAADIVREIKKKLLDSTEIIAIRNFSYKFVNEPVALLAKLNNSDENAYLQIAVNDDNSLFVKTVYATNCIYNDNLRYKNRKNYNFSRN